MTSATDLHFIFIKNPTVTYDPNGGKDYKAYNGDRIYNTDEAENVYSFKSEVGQSDTGATTTFIPPYVSKAAEGQNDGWRFTGWKLTGDIVDNIPAGIEKVNAEKLGSLILPAEHTIACDYSLDGASGERAAQYFKIYGGNVSLQGKQLETDTEVKGVLWKENEGVQYDKQYANVHRGLTMVAQWRWRQAIIPQSRQDSGKYIDSNAGGTVEITSVTDTSDVNYNPKYNANGGKSYFAETDEKVVIKATANNGWSFIGWYDDKGNLVSTNAEYLYADKSFYVSDLLPDGLKIDTASIKVQVKNTETNVVEDVLTDAYTLDTTPTSQYTFKLSVDTSQYAAGWSGNGGKQLVITYTATFNNNNTTAVNSKETNTATFDYSIDPNFTGRHIQTTASADVNTFGIKINKYDSGNENTKLANARFDLYRTATHDAGNSVKIPHTDIYGIKLEGSKATGDKGIAVFEKYEANADKYDYYLVEVAAPSGYNLLVETVKVNFADNDVDGDGYCTVNIPNISMIEMPVTGGFSTVIFYVIGIALMLSALAAYIIFLKKVKAKENR